MEIEAFDESKLNKAISLLQPDMDFVEKRNYGTLIQDLLKEKVIIEKYRRVCVFDPILELKVFELFGLL